MATIAARRVRPPYVAPDTLDGLRGPSRGVLTLPIHIHWSPQRDFDLGDPGQAAVAYGSIIREADEQEQTELLDRQLLLDLWPDLFLPDWLKRLWESRFPELGR